MFQYKWFREFMRRNTRPIPEDNAMLWKRRLSFAYVIVAWHAFGLVCYMIYSGKSDWARKYKSEEELAMTPGNLNIIRIHVNCRFVI